MNSQSDQETDASTDLSAIEAPPAPLGAGFLTGTDEGKKLRPRIGSSCCFAIHLGRRFVSRTPIELSTLRCLLLLCASYRESRDQRENENGHDHEVQFHVMSPFMRRQRNEQHTTLFPAHVGPLGCWLSFRCEIAKAAVAQPVTKKPRQRRGFLLPASGGLHH
jgi:hypothetical protein